MQDIISEVNKHGFFPSEVIADGKIRRFKRTPQDKHIDAWYVAYENHSISGDKFHFYVGGDWREPDNEIKISSKKKLSSIDRKIVDIQIEETKRQIEIEREQLRTNCEKECEHIWSTAQDFIETDYTAKKKIKGDFKVKTKFSESGRMVLVPVKNIDNKLVGMQKIYPNGKKYFHPGTAKRGAFHLIGDYINGEAYICEGFATGATIHMATGKPVAVAFDAGNLVQVAKEIRRKHRETKIVVCGDDDKWTEGNPGREMATKAAKESMGIAIFPSFEEDKEGLTDFNDLYLSEGLAAVSKVFTDKKGEHHYLKPLGTHGDKFFYISSQGNRVVNITTNGHNKNNLFSLMPLQYWETIYESKRGTRWDQAFSDLMDSCQRVGAFNPEIIRGVGVWEDRGRLLINMGNGLYHGGMTYGLGEIETKFIYQAGQRIPKPHEDPLTIEECKALTDTIGSLNWKKDESVFLLSGFITLARFCGAMNWRPHIWITGSAGAGKSTIMERLIRALMGDISFYFLGNTTEAGMRQSIGYDARPVIFDEFETNDKTTDLRVKAVLDLIRQASSESDARIAKGSAGGSAIDYRATFCAVVSSIRTNLTNEADRSRFAVLELEKIEKNATQWEGVKKKLDLMTPEFSSRLFSRVFGMWDTVKKNRKILQRALAEKYDQRVGQQYGTLLAGYNCLISDTVLTDEETEKLVSFVDHEERLSVVMENDETDCFNHLLQTKVRLEVAGSFFERNISEFVEEAKHSDFRKALRRTGLDVIDNCLLVANSHAELAKIFKETKWASGWKNSLGRLKNAIPSKDTHSFGTTSSSRYVKIPLGS